MKEGNAPRPGLLQRVRDSLWNPTYDQWKRSGLSSISNPSNWLMEALGGIETTSGEKVNRQSSLSFSALYAGLDLIASTIAQLPIKEVRYSKGGTKEVVTDSEIAFFFNQKGNNYQSAYNVRYQHSISSELDGNGILVLRKDLSGRLTGIEPVLWSAVSLHVSDRDNLYYQVHENYLQQSVTEYLAPEYIVHETAHNVRGFCGTPLYSYHLQANTIGQALATSKAGASHFKNGMLQRVGFLFPGVWRQAERENWQNNFQNQVKGVDNMGRPVVIDQGIKPFHLNFSPEASQYLESHKFSINDIARILRIPPHKIGDLEKATFSNITEENLSFLKDSIRFRLERNTQALENKLLPASLQGKHHLEYDELWLLKGDFQSRSAYYEMMWRIGVFTINDILRMEDMNTIGPEGDERFLQLGFGTVANVINAPDNEATMKKMQEQLKSLHETFDYISQKNGTKILNGHAN